MTPYQELLTRWADQLSPQDQQALKDLDAREAARTAYVLAPGDADTIRSGFMSITRVFGHEAVPLFGQEAPALAYNRITITRAVPSPQGGYAPGAIVFEGRLSDRALTVLVMESNRGRTNATITAERLGADTLPPYTPPQDLPGDTALHDMRAKHARTLHSKLGALREGLSAGGSAKVRKDTLAALRVLRSEVHDAGGVSFALTRRQDALSRRRVELVSEAAHAALHSARITEAMARPRLAPPAAAAFEPTRQRATNPMLNAALDPMEPHERAAVLRALRLEADDIAQHGGQKEAFGDGGTLSWPSGRAMEQFSKAAKARVERLSRVVRQALFRDNAIDPRCFTMGLTWIDGWAGGLHSSLPATTDRYVSLHIESAWMESRYGDSAIISAHDSLLELLFTPDDLMMALRGHPTQTSTPCTFRTLAGQSITSHDRPHSTSQDTTGQEAQERVRQSPAAQDLDAVLDAIESHLATPSAGKAWKEAAQQLSDTLEAAIAAYETAIDAQGYGPGLKEVQDQMHTKVRHDLQEMRASLPEPALKALLGR